MKRTLIIIISVFMFSCKYTDQETRDYNIGKSGNLKQCIITIEVDSCEYLAGHVPDGDFGWVMTHKGNCKNPIHKH